MMEKPKQNIDKNTFAKTMGMLKLSNYKNIEVITKGKGFDYCKNNSKSCFETGRDLGI